jgi:hypothetical protein
MFAWFSRAPLASDQAGMHARFDAVWYNVDRNACSVRCWRTMLLRQRCISSKLAGQAKRRLEVQLSTLTTEICSIPPHVRISAWRFFLDG